MEGYQILLTPELDMAYGRISVELKMPMAQTLIAALQLFAKDLLLEDLPGVADESSLLLLRGWDDPFMATVRARTVKPDGIIGITDDGYPIVTGEYTCPHWQSRTMGLCTIHECWYCKFADFRKTPRVTLQKSICRNPSCRIVSANEIPTEVKNEGVRWGG